MRHLPCKDVTVLLNDEVDQRTLANAARSDQDQRFVLQRCRVERMEVFLAVDENIVL